MSLKINDEITALASKNGFPHWKCISIESNQFWRRNDGREHFFSGFGNKTWMEELCDIDEACPLHKKPIIANAASVRNYRHMEILAKFCQCDISYKDLGRGESYTLVKDGQTICIKAREGDSGGIFLSVIDETQLKSDTNP